MTVYYVCHVNDERPTGGVLLLYRHVDALNAAGIDAAVVHGRRNFRCTWFENNTRIVSTPLEVSERDLLVLPEWLNPMLPGLAPGVRKVSLNQAPYFTFRNSPWDETHPYSRTRDLAAVACVSADSEAYLRYAFPGLRVERLYNHYGGPPFTPPDGAKERLIAYMPRRRPQEARQVLSILRQRGVLSGWRVVGIDGLPRTAVAQTLRRSALFLSFAQHEGFGLPAVEAMACGAHVIGYTGFGGSEFFDPRYAHAVPDGDVVAFARAVEAWTGARPPGSDLGLGHASSDFIRSLYPEHREAESVVSFFRSLEPSSMPPRTHLLRGLDTWLPGQGPRAGLRRGAANVKRGVIQMATALRR